MMKQPLVLYFLLCILIIAILVAPVSAGLTVINGEKINSPYGATSPVITVTDSEIPDGGTITIDVMNLYLFVNSGTFSDNNVEISSDSAAATWSSAVSGYGGVDQILTLTSSAGPTLVGENITVTFTGAGGNPWIAGSIDMYGSDLSIPLTVTRTDTYETADPPINFMIETPTPPMGGLTIADGERITTSLGATSPVITIADSDIPDGGTITIKVPELSMFTDSGVFTDLNVKVSTDAEAAIWSSAVSNVRCDICESGIDQILTLTSNGPTYIGESVTLTFTGAEGNPWLADSFTAFGDVQMPLTVTRTDTFQTASLNFRINTTPPSGGLLVTDGAKISSVQGTASPSITITYSDISMDNTITIDVSGLNAFVASGTLTDANVEINDTASTANWTREVAGNILTLVSSDGPTIVGESVTVTFTGAEGNPWIPNTHGEQTVVLTAIRSDGLGEGTFNFTIETIPPPGFAVTANFTASPTAELAPLAVAFTDTSTGNATSWHWEFGDGSTSTLQNPDHLYSTVGTYTVILTAGNEYGSDTRTRWDYIHVMNGAIQETNTSIDGLTVTNCAGPQTVTVDTSVLPAALIPNTSVLEIYPSADRGFNTITIYALNGVGFSQNGNLITGNPTSVHLVSEEIAPSSGFSDQTGAKSSFNYSVDLPSYPCNAILSTKIREGVIPIYDTNFRKIVDGNNASVVGTAYTATINKSNFPPCSNVRIHMSIGSGWNTYPNLPGAPGMIFIWRISDNETQGQIFPTTYLYTSPGDSLDYYEAESPLGLSTFGISSLTGNNNPFQMITLILSEIISPPDTPPSSDSSSTYIPADVVTQNTTYLTTIPPILQDPGITAKIYSNEKGVVTQATVLHSSDGLATVTIGTGIVAIDAEGKPLSSVSIRAIPAEDMPNTSPGASFSFAGRAYELLPDGAAFSPGIMISFTAPNVQFGQVLLVKTYDHATDTWQDVPSTINPETGIITAHISHFCCFALFAETVTPEFTSAVTTQVPAGPKANVPAPTAMSNFMGMILWVADLVQKNTIIFIGIIIVVIAIFLYGRKRRRDLMMKLT